MSPCQTDEHCFTQQQHIWLWTTGLYWEFQSHCDVFAYSRVLSILPGKFNSIVRVELFLYTPLSQISFPEFKAQAAEKQNEVTRNCTKRKTFSGSRPPLSSSERWHFGNTRHETESPKVWCVTTVIEKHGCVLSHQGLVKAFLFLFKSTTCQVSYRNSATKVENM